MIRNRDSVVIYLRCGNARERRRRCDKDFPENLEAGRVLMVVVGLFWGGGRERRWRSPVTQWITPKTFLPREIDAFFRLRINQMPNSKFIDCVWIFRRKHPPGLSIPVHRVFRVWWLYTLYCNKIYRNNKCVYKSIIFFLFFFFF